MSDIGNKEILAKNLAKQIEESKKTRAEICEALGIAYSTFSEWVTAKKYPRIDKIEMLAEYFGVKKSDLIENNIVDDLAPKILSVIEQEKHINKYESTLIPDELMQVILNRLEILGFDVTNNKADLMSLQTLIQLADEYNVSLDYLVGRTEKNAPIQADRDVFVEVFSRLTEQEIDSLIDYAKFLLSKR